MTQKSAVLWNKLFLNNTIHVHIYEKQHFILMIETDKNTDFTGQKDEEDCIY